MAAFNMPLSSWVELGFTQQHAAYLVLFIYLSCGY
jgi:hypothetical protein